MSTEAAEMAAFDGLPKILRDSLNYATKKISAESIAGAVGKLNCRRDSRYIYLRGLIARLCNE